MDGSFVQPHPSRIPALYRPEEYQMRNRISAILLLLATAAIASAQTPAAPPASQEQKPAAPPPSAPAPVQAVPKPDTTTVQLPPPPSMRNAITPEKPIKGVPEGVVPREPKAVVAETPGSSESASGEASQTPQTATAPGVAPAATAAGITAGTDSSAVAVLPPQSQKTPAPGAPRKKTSDTYREERSLYNAPTANLRTAKVVIDDEFNLAGMVYGEQLGFLRILSADANGDFSEVWKSPPLNSEVRGVFVENIDHAGEAEIVAYTLEGNIFIYGYDTHEMKYKTPEGTYQGINCMLIANLDNSPELELLFITKAGKLVQFDPVSKFEEWTSTDTYEATDMVIGNVDNDKNSEIVLNTGEVLNFQFKSVKWKMDSAHIRPNSRLYLIDVDSDGILELVVEYDQQYVRIFDIDQRREKW